MMLSWNAVRCRSSLALAVLLLAADRAYAFGPIELLSKANPVLPPHAVGTATNASLSADGRYVAFESSAPNLLPGVHEGNNGGDVFLWDRVAATLTLVSRSASSSTRTSNGGSSTPKVSADGNWVAFLSSSTDLVPGQIDSSSTTDVFLWQRATGAITLVSRAASSPLTTGNGFHFASSVDLSADGAWVTFQSDSTDLVAGQVDANGLYDVYLFDRGTGTTVLVSHASGSPATAGSLDAIFPRISADGNYIVFTSQSTNLAAGQSDANSSYDVFLYDRAAGTNTLVSHASGAAATAANGSSHEPVIGADGQWIAYSSTSSNLVAGQVSTLGTLNVFLYDRTAGTSALLSGANGSATTAANNFSSRPSISANGAYVAFESLSTNLTAGQTDSNNASDVFLFDRAGNTLTLISGASASTTMTANNLSVFPLISSDGGRVVFVSQATDLVAGQSDGNADRDVFLYTRASAGLALVSHGASPTLTGNGFSERAVLDGDGGHVSFASVATDLTGGSDTNGGSDVFVYTTADASLAALSLSPAVASATADALSSAWGLSADGRYVLLLSTSTNLFPGMTKADGSDSDVYLRDRAAGTTTLISHNFGSATTTGNHQSQSPSLSADGAYATYESFASTLVSGSDVGPPFGDSDVFLFDRAAGTNTLVSHAAGAPTTAAPGPSDHAKISAGGGYVVFANQGGNLVSMVTDANLGRDLYLFSRAGGQNVLVSRNSSSAITTGNAPSDLPSVSADGGFVAFLSAASNLVAGQMQNNADYNVFLFDRAAGTTALVSHASSSPAATGNAGVAINLLPSIIAPVVSADGAYVVFSSPATDLVTGQLDANAGFDVFLWERASGAITLVSHASGSAVTAGNSYSDTPAISADGRYIAYESVATDLVPGQTDANGEYDVFLYDRFTGTTTLVSHVPGSATATGTGRSIEPVVSADGSRIGFSSYNTSLVAGEADHNVSADIFLHDRLSATNRLLSHAAGSPLTAGNSFSALILLSADGATVAFSSISSDLVADDYNGAADAFVHDRPDLDYYTLTPCRLLDTRSGPAFVSGVTETMVLTGACGIPANARAVALNVTVTQSSGGGHLTLFPGDLFPVPDTSTINFQAGQTRANNAIASLAADGSLAIRPSVTGGGTVHVILDVVGYFVAGTD
jgi:Tol biopolymer transport system component